jgi:hypothetical protein
MQLIISTFKAFQSSGSNFFAKDFFPFKRNKTDIGKMFYDNYIWWSIRIASLPAKAIWNISKSALIEKKILYPRYQKYVQQHQSQLPELSPENAVILESLRQTGVYVSSLEALNIPHTEEFIAAAEIVAKELTERATLPESSAKHEVLANAAQILQHENLFQWGLNEKILTIVENYLQLPIAYDGPIFVRSRADGKEVGARKWHKDREDRHVLKVCVYLNDVQSEGGPFECLHPIANEPIYNLFQNQYKLLSDKALKTLLPSPDDKLIRTLVGSKGTVIFVDTALYYHRGKPPTQQSRTAIFFSYFSRRPRNPFFCNRSHLTQSNLVYLTRNSSEKERACVHWFDQLPWFAKQLPRSQN